VDKPKLTPKVKAYFRAVGSMGRSRKGPRNIPTKLSDPAWLKFFREKGAEGGRARARNNSPEQLSKWAKLGGRPRKKENEKKLLTHEVRSEIARRAAYKAYEHPTFMKQAAQIAKREKMSLRAYLARRKANRKRVAVYPRSAMRKKNLGAI
jgi:hypothetical protein